MSQELAVDLERTDVTGQNDYTKYIRFARVVKVYDADTLAESKEYGAVDLIWLDTGDNINGHIQFLKPGYSSVYGSGIIVMPNVNDIAACYAIQDAPPVILGFFSRLQFEAAMTADKEGYGDIGYIHPLKAGEILIKGRSQSEIYLQNDGRVKVTVQDGTQSVLNSTSSVQDNTEPYVNRPDGSILNTQVELTLGSDSDLEGSDAGFAKSVFSLKTKAKTTGTVLIPCVKGKLSYELPVDDSREIAEIVKINVITKDNGVESVKKEITKGIILRKKYTYLKEEIGKNGATKDPCSLDINNSFAYITIPAVDAGLIKSNTYIRVFYIATYPSISFVGNQLGDLFIDARNIVMRTTDSNAYLGLFSNGQVKLGGSSVDIGDQLHGNVKVDQAGVVLSSGINTNSKVITIGAENIIGHIGFRHYFYVSDELPVFYYDPLTKQFAICEVNDYDQLSDIDVVNLKPRNIDPSGEVQGFTKETMDNLIQAYKDANNGTAPHTYKELKTL